MKRPRAFTAARLHCRARLRSDDLGALLRHCIGIGQYFNLHGISQLDIGVLE
jgi:hypothetical protein